MTTTSEFSTAFIARLEKLGTVNVQRPGLAEATDMVRRGMISAVAIIPPGFGESSKLLNPNQKAIRLNMDPSRKLEAGFLQGMMLRTSFAMQAEALGGKKGGDAGTTDAGQGLATGGPQVEISDGDAKGATDPNRQKIKSKPRLGV